MPSQRPSRVIVDTNLWISFLIGRELQSLKNLILSERIKLITTDQLIDEIVLVTSREKLRKYFNPAKVADLLSLLEIVSEKVRLKRIEKVCRDPKDDFLLALSKESKADFLITGDNDLLEIKVYGKTEILNAKQFKDRMK